MEIDSKAILDKLIQDNFNEIDQKVITNLLKSNSASQQKWREISQKYLKPSHDFSVHKALFQGIYPNQDEAYAYIPKELKDSKTNLLKLMKLKQFHSVKDFHRFSCREKNEFWALILDKMKIQFEKPYHEIINTNKGDEYPKFLTESSFNIIDNALKHDDEKIAIIYPDENNKKNEIKKITYKQLSDKVNQIAFSLISYGFQKGDRIAIDMVMTWEAVAIYLAIIKAGLSVVSIADSFAPDEIKVRLDITKTKAIFTQDYIYRNDKKLPLFDKVKEAHPENIIVLADKNSEIKLRESDIYFEDFLEQGEEKYQNFQSIKMNPDDEINILFSSGTTSTPKAIPWFQSTPVKIFSDSYLHLDTKNDDIWCWPTNLGWMMGPWVTFASLLHGATLALYPEAPTTEAFCQFVEKAKITKLGVIPSIVSAIRNNQFLDSNINWTNIKAFGTTGECSNFDDVLYLMSKTKYAPVIEYCGGTEIAGSYLTSTLDEPLIPATFSAPAFGLDLCLLDKNQNLVKNEGVGEITLMPPSFGLSVKLLNKDHHQVYYQNMPTFKEFDHCLLRRHGDEIMRLKNGYYRALGRSDDTMNLGGIKISSVEIERVVNELDYVMESSAIAISPNGGGPSQLIIYLVLNGKINLEKNEIKKEVQKNISQNLNPLFKVADIIMIEKLPRTASNKVMRRVLRDNYQKEKTEV